MSTTWRRLGAPLAALLVVAVMTSASAHGDLRASAPRQPEVPSTGGSLTYGTDRVSTSDWCLPDVRLEQSGVQVAQAVYETLTVPDAAGRFVPYLARSITHNGARTQWTITLRRDITFHDGSPLNADAVIENLDAYRLGPVFSVTFADVAAIEKVDDLAVRVTTRVPWVTFPAYLWSSGRLGIVAPAQLADPATCARELIGTGPFRLQEFTPDGRVVVTRNPEYWQRDRNGTRLPYLDRLTFVPEKDTLQRLNGLKGGDLDIIQVTDLQAIDFLRDDARAKLVVLLESRRAPEVDQLLLNVGAAPFDRRSCRRAVAFATDREALIQSDDETVHVAAQPFARGSLGYERGAASPTLDPERAGTNLERCRRELAATDLRFTLHYEADPVAQIRATAIQRQMAAVGIQVDLADPAGDDQNLERARRGDYEAMLWRTEPSPDPDTFYASWHSTTIDVTSGEVVPNPSDLGRIDDPVVDRALEQGRSDADPVVRQAAYERIGRQFADQAYAIWISYVPWAFAAQPTVAGLSGPRLPSGDRRGRPVAGVEPVLGLWRTG